MAACFTLGIEILSGNWWLRGGSMNARYYRSGLIKKQRKAVQCLLSVWERRGDLPSTLPLKITLVRVMGPRQRKFDKEENLPVGFKHIKDTIAARYGLDDADPRITWEYAQERGQHPSSRMDVVPLDALPVAARE